MGGRGASGFGGGSGGGRERTNSGVPFSVIPAKPESMTTAGRGLPCPKFMATDQVQG
jgi:hypothetical protein